MKFMEKKINKKDEECIEREPVYTLFGIHMGPWDHVDSIQNSVLPNHPFIHIHNQNKTFSPI